MTIWLGHLLVLAAALVGAALAVSVLWYAAPPLDVPLPRLFPFAAMSLHVDGLSAYFVLVLSLVTVAAAIYGPSYLGDHAHRPGVQTLALDAFVACMALVCCAGDALTFLFAWVSGARALRAAQVASTSGANVDLRHGSD